MDETGDGANLTQPGRSTAPERPLLRLATRSDVPELQALIARSATRLSRGYYTDAQAAAAIAHVFGVDTQLVDDGTYFVVERHGVALGCGGWSRRATLFGADATAWRADAMLDPARDAARIRAMFVAPEAARLGIGTLLLQAGIAAAARAGFRRLALMATLPGLPFYARHGFVAGTEQPLDLGGVTVPFVPMERDVVADWQQIMSFAPDHPVTLE